MFCSKCGNKLNSESNFCSNCGTATKRTFSMKAIKITRKKVKFIGRAIPYHCILNCNLDTFINYCKENKHLLNKDAMERALSPDLLLPLKDTINIINGDIKMYFDVEHFKKYLQEKGLDSRVQVESINNNETKTIRLDNEKNTLLIVGATSTGISFSRLYEIDENSSINSYMIKTTYSWTTGANFEVYEN